MLTFDLFARGFAVADGIGRAIAERREYVGYPNQTDLINALDRLLEGFPAFQKFSQQWLSRLERDRNGDVISSAHGPKLRALAHVLRWSMAEMQEATGVDLGVPKGWTVAGGSQQSLSPVGDVRRVPVIGLASAGAPVADEEDARIIGWEYPAESEYRTSMLVLEVDGESMTNGDAEGLNHGDRLYVDPRDTDLQEGKVYVIHVHGNGIVVKRARKLGTDWWLFSDNTEFTPTRPDEASIIGRVFFHQPRGKRL